MNNIPWRAPVYGWLTNLVGCGLLAALICAVYHGRASWLTVYARLFGAFSALSLLHLVRLGWRQSAMFIGLAGLSFLAIFLASAR